MQFNKTLSFIVALLCLSSSSVVGQNNKFLQFETVQALRAFLKYSPTWTPLISAHRGGPTVGFPENAIETFANTITFHAAIIETDISLTKDSILVMMHDNTLERTTTGIGRINDYTYDQLQQLYLKDTEARVTTFRIPTLAEVLEWSRGKVILNLDVKRTVPMQMVVDAVRAHQAEPYTVVITYNANQAKELADIAPELMISVSAKGKEDLERIEKMGVKVENLTAFVGVSEPSKEVYEYLHSRGIVCTLGTMGNLDRSAATRGDQLYQQLIRNGADIISTDRNQEASKVLF